MLNCAYIGLQFKYAVLIWSIFNATQLDTEEVTVENCMSKSFDQVIKMQLDPVWNQLVSTVWSIH